MRDDEGWHVPRPGTKARIIYGLRKYGLTAGEIAKETGYDAQQVRVVISEYRWWDRHNREEKWVRSLLQ